jgi:drug/metabolite transporter (DMT)-like permease
MTRHPDAATRSSGALLMVGACLFWAIDNNRTRKVSSGDAMWVAGLKALRAGACTIGLALADDAAWHESIEHSHAHWHDEHHRHRH